MEKFFFLVSVFALMISRAEAKVEVSARLDREQIAVGEAVTLQVMVSSDDSLTLTPPQVPALPGTQLLHQWTSTQTRSSVVSRGQGIDFQTIRSQIFNYQILIQNEGETLIPALAIEVAGTTYRTSPLKVRAYGEDPQNLPQMGGGGGGAGQPRDPIDELEERFNQLLQRQFGGMPNGQGGGFVTGPGSEKDAFFIRAEIDKTEAFKGEQITASWYLYTRGRVQDIDTLKYPELKGFWKEDIQISTHLNFEQDVINGVPYNRALLVSYALFPIEAGKAVIDSYKAKATIAGGFGFGRGYQNTKSSAEIPVLIKPLPSDGQPADFTGAVGEFQLMVDAPNKSVIAHQPFPLRVRFEGRGNAKMIELPKLPLGDKLEVYDVSNESNFFKNGQSFKEFTVQLIAREAGDLEIPALTASFFQPSKKGYVTLSSQPIRLNVLPGARQDSLGEERVQAEGEQGTGLPKPRGQWNPAEQAKPLALTLWGLLFGLAVVVVIGFWSFERGWFRRPPSLEEALGTRLQNLDQLLAKKQLRQLGIEATNTIYFLLGELSGEGGASQELDKVLARVAPSLRRDLEGPLRKHLDYFGVLGFGPRSFVDSLKDSNEVKKHMQDLKEHLKSAAKNGKGSVNQDA